MDVCSVLLGIFLSVIFLPISTIIIVSLRRRALDGSYIDGLSSKYVLITGCGSGFGFELAKQLDSLGCHVIATSRRKEGLDQLKSITSSRLYALQMDVTKMESIETAERRVRELLPSSNALWGIVNNAGIRSFAPSFDFDTMENMKKVVDVNLWGTVAVTKTFLSYLKRSKGRIVNVSSIEGRLALPGSTAYAISKFGVTAFSDCLNLELSPFKISFHLIEPGNFKTNIFGNNLEEDTRKFWDDASEDLRHEYGKEWWDQRVSNLQSIYHDNRISDVTNCIEHALFSSQPKRRYFPGNVASFGVWWAALLPTEVSDKIIQRACPSPTPASVQQSS